MNKSDETWFKLLTGKIYNERVRANILQALPYWIASIITGVIAVLYARMFAWLESVTHTLVDGRVWILFLLTPGCFVLAWWLVRRFDQYAGGSGIPQVIAAIELANPKYNFLVDKFLSVRAIVVKVLSSGLMVFGGGAVGREGPTVQVAASVFRKVNQLLPASWPKISKKNMIMTGAAAGLAAAFNTPLGGIVFAVEELAKTHINFFKTALFTAVIIAGLTAQGIAGPYLYLGYPDISNPTGYLILFVMLVACVAGLAGSLMSVAILRIMHWKRTFTSTYQHLAYVIMSALIVAALACFFNYGILGSGKAEMSRILFTNDKHVGLSLAVARIVGSVAAFTTGAAGGVFAPALASGATIGGLLAELFHFTAANANILALAGMVAFLTGVTRSPFTSAILVLEMTDRHNVIFHLMLAGLVATMFSNLIDRHSLYEHLKDNYLKTAYSGEAGPVAETEEDD
jgi:H+/Cl- antiporter ClcA